MKFWYSYVPSILTPLARRGDPRAARELLRRGRNVLFVPDQTQYMDAEMFQKLLAGLLNEK